MNLLHMLMQSSCALCAAVAGISRISFVSFLLLLFFLVSHFFLTSRFRHETPPCESFNQHQQQQNNIYMLQYECELAADHRLRFAASAAL